MLTAVGVVTFVSMSLGRVCYNWLGLPRQGVCRRTSYSMLVVGWGDVGQIKSSGPVWCLQAAWGSPLQTACPTIGVAAIATLSWPLRRGERGSANSHRRAIGSHEITHAHIYQCTYPTPAACAAHMNEPLKTHTPSVAFPLSPHRCADI